MLRVLFKANHIVSALAGPGDTGKHGTVNRKKKNELDVDEVPEILLM